MDDRTPRTIEDFEKWVEQRKAQREPYPTTIIQTRYGGTYEGGAWAAFHLDESDVPEAATDSDIECMEFWESEEATEVGVGATPDLAFADLKRRMGFEATE